MFLDAPPHPRGGRDRDIKRCRTQKVLAALHCTASACRQDPCTQKHQDSRLYSKYTRRNYITLHQLQSSSNLPGIPCYSFSTHLCSSSSVFIIILFSLYMHTCATGTSWREFTRRGVRMCSRLPWPPCPSAPYPHENTSLFLDSATMWKSPAHPEASRPG